MRSKTELGQKQQSIPFFRSLRGKLSVWFLLLSFSPLVFTGLLAAPNVQKTLEQHSFDQLVAVRTIKAHQVETFFMQQAANARTLSRNPTTIAAMVDLSAAFATLGPESARELYLEGSTRSGSHDTSDYGAAHAKYHPVFSHYTEIHEYYDLYLIEPQNGYIVYTVTKGDGYGHSLFSSDHVGTKIADVFTKARSASDPEATFLTDFEVHHHKEEQHEVEATSFIASPIYDGTQLVGILLLQTPITRLNAIMNERAGLGETGETYLVGPDKLMRSDSRFSPESTVLEREVDTTSVQKALAGKSGTVILDDYRGVPVLSAYQPLVIQDLNWVILAEIDRPEAYAPAMSLLVVLLGAFATTVVVITVIAMVLARRISKPLVTITNATTRIAAGDLEQTVDVSASDETGILAGAFNQMVVNLRYLVEQAADTSQQLSTSSQQLAAMMEEMNAGSEQVVSTVSQMAQGAAAQSGRAEEASHSMAQLASATGQITENARKTGNASVQAQRLVRDSAHVVQTLGDRLSEIERIVTIVDKIADQTNLLSLNASIEAARAGEYGAGFAVVADEVRRLADHSAAQVSEIAALSQEVTLRLEEIRASMSETEKAVGQTSLLAQETATATKTQMENSEKMVSAVNEMATVAEQSAAASEEIAASVEEQMASLDQIAYSTQSLAELASNLQQTVSQFTTGSVSICVHFAACPIFSQFSSEGSLESYVNQYCKGDFKTCARKMLQEAGEAVPQTLLPDGTSLA